MSNPGTAAAQSWPRLSETLAGPRHPEQCQSCGVHNDDAAHDLARWQEHDWQDHPERVYLVLCQTCSDRLIEKHPRLYHRLQENEPVPGTMAICLACPHRDGLRCASPLNRQNGGPGMRVFIAEPFKAFIDGRTGPKGGRRFGQQIVQYPRPASGCEGRGDPPPAEAMKEIISDGRHS